MSQSVSPASRLSNGTNPASDGTGPDAPDSDSAPTAERPDVPTVEERVQDVLEQYPDRAFRPLSTTHGRRLREECLEPAETVEVSVPAAHGDTRTVTRDVDRPAVPLVVAVEEMLEWYESYRHKSLKLAKGPPGHPDREDFLVPFENSLTPEYQQEVYARLKGLERQTVGGEYPDGSSAPGAFEDAVTVMFGLTSSSTPDGEFRPPADHDREIRDAWSGNDGVRRTLRYVLKDRLGLDSEDFAWWFQSEPHPGGGDAAGYSHSHPVVVLDAAAVDGDHDPTDPETYRPVIAKHVAECEAALWDAHRLEKAVTVKAADEIGDFASYLSEYLQLAPDTDLLERSTEYLMWAATQWATTTQKYSKSRTATEAITADACHQRAAHPETDQDHDHGEKVVRANHYGTERYECAACGSAWQVDQEPATLVEARREAEPSVVADGGTEAGEVVDSALDVDGDGDDLLARWPSAQAAWAVDGDGVESFEVLPEWRAESAVDTSTGEETTLGAPGGVRYGEVVVEGAGTVGEYLAREFDVPALPSVRTLRGPEPWDGGPAWVTEPAVRLGRVPPPEVVEREFMELSRGGRASPKEWPDDWYARRYERAGADGDGADGADGDGGTDAADGPDAQLVERAAGLVERGEVFGVVAALGAVGLPPSARSRVEQAVEGE